MNDIKKYFISENKVDENNYELEAVVTDDFKGYEGHFPGHPILPAIFEIGLAVEGVNRVTGKKYSLSGVKSSKFSAMVEPGDKLKLLLKLKPDGDGSSLKTTAKIMKGDEISAKMSFTLIRVSI